MLIENSESFAVSSTWDIISHLINKSFYKYHSDVSDGTRKGILNLLSQNTVHKGSWVENFPIRHFLELKTLMEKSPRLFPENQNLKEEIEVFEKKYRNKLSLTPQEWDLNVSDLYSFTKEKWYLLVDSFKHYQEILSRHQENVISLNRIWYNNR